MACTTVLYQSCSVSWKVDDLWRCSWSWNDHHIHLIQLIPHLGNPFGNEELNAHGTSWASSQHPLCTGYRSPSQAHLFKLQSRIRAYSVNRRAVLNLLGLNLLNTAGTNSCLEQTTYSHCRHEFMPAVWIGRPDLVNNSQCIGDVNGWLSQWHER